MNITILGAGMVGRAMALDLAPEYTITSIDRSENNLEILKQRNPEIQTRVFDLTQYDTYPEILSGADLVITAVPGFMGFKTLEAVIRAGKNVADISFFPEDVLQLDSLAKEKGVTVITDIGVAPGMSNLILGRYNEEFRIHAFECYVGGLPQHPQAPFLYKAPFSPIDVIEEYTRPARLKENGKIVEREALTDREILDFGKAGQLEAFNTDGLRSLLFTLPDIPEMKEKTLRYPGHLDLILQLKAAGFFNTEKMAFTEMALSPLEFTSRLLIDQWKLGEDEPEFTVMRVILDGEKEGRPVRVQYDLYDEFDKNSRISSMARTTGYTCTAAANLIIKGIFTEKGVYPPEWVGRHETCFQYILGYLQERGVFWKITNT